VTTFQVRAPGRVNLIGEHTDYNDGFVLPAAISLDIRLSVEPNDAGRVDITLAESGDRRGFVLNAIGAVTGTWIDYVAGVARELTAAGWPVGGFSGVLTSTLPMGSGLSSSAALELAAAWALLAAGGAGGAVRAGGDALDRMELARICQRAEGAYVGVKTGLMDQFASSCGVAGHALLLDCRSLDWRPVALPAGLVLVAVNTGSPRRLAASQYNERRAQCERGVDILAARGEPVRALRDATVGMLDAARDELDDVIYRRCRHVVEENERAVAAVAAIAADDRAMLGRLFAASHASLRDLYEVSSPALDAAVEIAALTRGVVATRMTGGGFGGCTVNLVEHGAVDALRAALERDYTARTGLTATVHEVEAADGAGLVP
jgi:galactokinase